jgi:hypothetical protein
MSSILISFLVFAVVFEAARVGMRLGAFLPGVHLASESKDTVRLAMGLVATLTVLILGLLVASAKVAYDAQKKRVTQMTAKVAFLDRLLAVYGPGAAECRAVLRQGVARAMARIWPKKVGGFPGAAE